MVEITVGARELKARLGRYLQIVREGGTVLVTDRGKPLGRIVPEGERTLTVEERANAAVGAGLASWSGHKPSLRRPSTKPRDGGTVAALVSEGRE